MDRAPDVIDVDASIDDFFRDAVAHAAHASGHRLSYAGTLYLAGLLADYGRPGAVRVGVFSEPLVVLLQRALQAPPTDRFGRLRHLGDHILYLTGFFAEHLETRGVAADYAHAVGARAYQSAAAVLRAGGSTATTPDLFSELSGRFRDLVELVSVVSDDLYAGQTRRDGDVLRVYERWMKTGSASLADTLAAWGLVPQTGDDVLH